MRTAGGGTRVKKGVSLVSFCRLLLALLWSSSSEKKWDLKREREGRKGRREGRMDERGLVVHQAFNSVDGLWAH